MTEDALSELIHAGTLTAGINLSNGLLVTGTGADGRPQGVAPDMAAALAAHLGLGVAYVTYATPGEVADAVARGEWDVGLIAEDPTRAETIAFCGAYAEIEATYLVPADSPFHAVEDVDRPGVRIAVSERSAYDLYLARTLAYAELRRAKGFPGACALFVSEKLDALAGLVPQLQEGAEDLPGSRVIPGRYTSVRQAIGTRPENVALKRVIEGFLAEAKASGLVAGLIEKHGVAGKLAVAADT
ncbi:MAG: transporter substrate-binding domain-containing protein [Alphaproteobacteria bacterium]|nr:transporter substrate-binding domain-containing protein [Alphaproteobacteria bacterium]